MPLLASRGQRVIYTTPLKALSNQKLVEMRKRFGENRVGLATGDVSLNTQVGICSLQPAAWCDVTLAALQQDIAADSAAFKSMRFHLLCLLVAPAAADLLARPSLAYLSIAGWQITLKVTVMFMDSFCCWYNVSIDRAMSPC